MKIICFTVLLLFSLFSFAQNSAYTITWISGAYQKNFKIKENKKALNIRFDGSYRSIEWFKYTRQFLIREITTYNFNDNLQLGVGPCWSWLYPYYDVKPVLEFRPTFQFTAKTIISNNKYENGKFENNKSEIALRFRWEMRYFKTNGEWSEGFHRPRFNLRCNIPLTDKLSFVPSTEIMFQKNPGDTYKFSVFRIVPAFNFKHRKINYSFSYMFQFLERGNSDEIDHIYSTNISN